MANTYTQLYIQFVFAVQNRASLILPTWKDELYKYMELLKKFEIEYDERYILNDIN